MLEKSGDQLDKGSEKSLNGLADALDESVKGLEQTGVIRNAKNTVKKLIDDEWEKYTETENHLLNIDTTAPMISFTSNQNRTPESIQIIMRTAEISKKSPRTRPLRTLKPELLRTEEALPAGSLTYSGRWQIRLHPRFRLPEPFFSCKDNRIPEGRYPSLCCSG